MEETIVKQIHTSLLQIPTQTKTVVKQLICSSRNELGSRLTQTNNADDSAIVDWENSHALQEWEIQLTFHSIYGLTPFHNGTKN